MKTAKLIIKLFTICLLMSVVANITNAQTMCPVFIPKAATFVSADKSAAVGSMSYVLDGEGATGVPSDGYENYGVYWLQSSNPVTFYFDMKVASTISRVKFYQPWGFDEGAKNVTVRLYNGATLLGTEAIVLPSMYPAGYVAILGNTYTNVTKIQMVILDDYNLDPDTPKRTSLREVVFGDTACIDTDGDGVADYIDLDDDNDGILDTDECPVTDLVTNGTFTGNATGWTLEHSWTYNVNRVVNSANGETSRLLQSISNLDKLPGNIIPLTFTVGAQDIGNNQSNTSALEIRLNGALYATINNGTLRDNSNVTITLEPGVMSNFTTFGTSAVNGYTTQTFTLWIPYTGPSTANLVFRKVAGNDDWSIDDVSIPAMICDTDGDGIFDHLDLDSDGDGCSDAIEGDAAFTTSNLVNSSMPGGNTGGSYTGTAGPVTSNLGNTVGDMPTTMGVPTIAETGQGVGGSKIATNYSQCLDSDGDGIPDWQDLDDDNDGILDTAEICKSAISTDFVDGQSTTVTTVSGANVVPTTATLTPAVSRYSLGWHYGDATGAVNKEMSINFSNPVYFANDNIDFRLGGLDNGSKFGNFFIVYEDGTRLSNLDFSLTNITGNITTSTINGAKAFNSGAGPNSSADLTLNGVDRSKRIIKMGYTVHALTGNSGTSENIRPRIQIDCDIDGDGIPNQLDLDSDGDGCPDAIEGDAAFTTSNLVNSSMPGGNTGGSYNGTAGPVISNLGNTVGSTPTTMGVPMIAGTGQNVGGSSIATIHNQCLDSDGDGYPDWQDLDDDNDGILDTAEICKSAIYTDFFDDQTSTVTSVSGANVVPTTATITPAINRYNIGWHFGDASGAINQEMSINFSNPVYFANDNIDFTLGEMDVPSKFGHFFIVYEDGTRLSNLNLSLANISPANGIILATTNGANSIETQAAQASADLTLLGVDRTKRIVKMGYTVLALNGEAYSETIRPRIQIDCDMDGDGIPNQLDLDSDGDGCVDALEGDENVINSQLVNAAGTVTVGTGSTANNQNLCASGSCVDTQGVPLVVNGGGAADIGSDQGQGLGIAYNSLLSSCKNYWIGTTDTIWDKTTNWTANVVPGVGEDVEFATTANNNGNPAVNDLYVPAATEKTIGNLINLSDKATVIPAKSSLIVNGNVTGSETDASKIQIKAAKNTENGTFIINCTAQSTSGSPDVYVTVDLYAKGKKDVETTWEDNISGSPTKGTTFKASYHWQHFGVPVETVKANPTFYGSFLRKYFENYNGTNTQYYQKWKDLTNESNLIAFEGYEITQDTATTYSIAGKLQYCDKTIELTRSAPVVTNSTNTNINNDRYGLGQNIFGNSYTASIDITKLDFTSQPKIEPTVYLYNTGRFTDWANTTDGGLNTGALSAGQYTSIPQNVASTIYDGRIPSMNGFLLIHRGYSPYYESASDVPVTMTLPYANNLLPNTKPQTAPRKPLSYLQVNLQSKSTRDNLWLFSEEGTTNGNDDGWDGRKFFGTPTAFIYTENADGPKQVNADKTIDGSVLSFYANDDTDYTLTLTKTNLEGYTDLQLIDLVTRTATPLTGDVTTYRFTADSKGKVIKRFIIANSAYIDLNSNKFKYLDGYVLNNNRLIINNFTPRDGTMYLHDISGKTLINRSIPTAVTEVPVSLQTGVYILNLQADGKQETIKLIIK